VDRVTGAPLPGAAFRYALEGAPFAYADDAGRYATRVSAGSEHHLYVTHEGYASLHWIWEVTDPDARHPPTVPLLPLSSIVGRVEDPEGRPLEGVPVFAASERGGGSIAEVPREVREAHGLTGRARERASSSASTDADGRFVLEVLPLESPYTLRANREGLAPCRSSPVLVAIPGERVDVALVCEQAAVVYGHVTQNGEPMRWGHLSALAPDGSYLGRGGTDGNGDYRMDRLAAGDVIVRVEGAADPPVEARLTVEAGQEYRQDFDWDEIRGRITGRVTHEDGRPAVAVPVWAQGDSGATETDATGAYELAVAPGPLYTVSVMGPFTRSVEGVAAGDENIDFVLPTVGTLNIQLVDADTREPLRLASDETRHRWLSWRAPGDALFQRVSRPALDVEGVVELELPVGEVELSLHLERVGYAARKVTLPVRDEPDPEPVPVLLQGGHSMRLRFVPDEAASGSTFPEFARVFVLEDSERGLLRGPFPDREASPYKWDADVDAWVGDPGLFERLVHAGSTTVVELTGLSAGHYTLLPFGADVRFTPATFDMPRPEDTVLEVRWSSGPR
jgi:hypothetical protein